MGVEQQKQRAGERAAWLVENGATVGLGSGSTALEFVRALGRRVQNGLEVRAVASSRRTARAARARGIPLIDLDGKLDVVVDGADAIERGTLHAIKGLGGSLTREKLTAEAGLRFVLIADHRKIVDDLAESRDRVPVPVEVVPFGWELTRERLSRFGDPILRQASNKPYMTDNGNLILDLFGADYACLAELGDAIKTTTGVVEHGLFLGMAGEAIIAWDDRVEELTVEGAV